MDTSKVTIAYEPIWAIDPGKIPPDAEYITVIDGGLIALTMFQGEIGFIQIFLFQVRLYWIRLISRRSSW